MTLTNPRKPSRQSTQNAASAASSTKRKDLRALPPDAKAKSPRKKTGEYLAVQFGFVFWMCFFVNVTSMWLGNSW